MAISTQKDAIEKMLERRHPILESEHPHWWKGKGTMQYHTFATREELKKHVEKNPDSWCNEVILSYSKPYRDMLTALDIPIKHPRLCFDVDYDVNGEPDPENFLRFVVTTKRLAKTVLSRYLNIEDFEPEFLEMDGSRQKTKTTYRHSTHILVQNVAIEDWTDGKKIREDMIKEWERTESPTEEEKKSIDSAIYTENRGMRLMGSKKEKGGVAFSCPLPFEESLITSYDKENICLITKKDVYSIHQPTRRDLKRKRILSIPNDENITQLDDSNPYVMGLHNWITKSPLSISLGWSDANILESYSYDTSNFIYFKVGHATKGTPHICMAGENHNGNANQTWRIRIDKRNHEMASACWANGRTERACQSADGSTRYFAIKNGRGKLEKII
jgi:hypothetical protein